MFLRYDNVQFEQAGFNDRAAVNGMQYATPPKTLSGDRSGAGLVLQWLESFVYRTNSYSAFPDEDVNRLYSKAKTLDTELGLDRGPATLKSLLEGCGSLRLVKNCGIRYFNTLDALRYFVKEYKTVIVELKLTDTTKNAYGFDITAPGTEIDSSITKGFVCCGYGNGSFLLQNSLGRSCGVKGFNRISDSVMDSLFMKGGCFSVI